MPRKNLKPYFKLYNSGWATNTNRIKDDVMEKIQYKDRINFDKRIYSQQDEIDKNNQRLIKNKVNTIEGGAGIANLMKDENNFKKK